jgi:hypothetical protein
VFKKGQSARNSAHSLTTCFPLRALYPHRHIGFNKQQSS